MSLPDDQPLDALRKQPTQARAWRTVLTLFEATAQILDQEGDAALTTNRVAERAGFSIGTLYQYFPSMDAILLAMIDYERRRILKLLQDLLTEAETAPESPEIYIGRYTAMLVAQFSGGSSARRALLKRGWRMDHLPPMIALTQDMAERIRAALRRRAHPDFPPPDDLTLFAVTRSVLGAIRAAEQEDAPWAGADGLAEILTRQALALLRA